MPNLLHRQSVPNASPPPDLVRGEHFGHSIIFHFIVSQKCAPRTRFFGGVAGAEANAYIPLFICSAVPIPTPILIYTLAPPPIHVKRAIAHDPLIQVMIRIFLSLQKR